MLVLLVGRFNEALRLAGRCKELDPLNDWAPDLIGRALLAMGRAVEAESEFRIVLDLNPHARGRHGELSLALLEQGRIEEAEVEALKEVEQVYRIHSLAVVRWAQDRREEADALLAELERDFGFSAAFQIAEVYGHRGEADAAFRWLERSYELYDPGMYWCRISSLLTPLHDDARWLPYLRKLGLID